MEHIGQKLNDFVTKCRQAGLKVTHQRTEIMRELAGTQEHPDAETLHNNVRERIPAISLDTIYRTLRLFEDKGIITRVGSIRDRARFDANTEPHHHFICRHCGKIRDFHSNALGRFTLPLEVKGVGTVQGVYVELQGRCQSCQAESHRKP